MKKNDNDDEYRVPKGWKNTVEEFQDNLRDRMRKNVASRKTKDMALTALFIICGCVSVIMFDRAIWQLPFIFFGMAIVKVFQIRIKSKKEGKYYDSVYEDKDDFDWHYYESGQDIRDKEKAEREKDKEEDDGIA